MNDGALCEDAGRSRAQPHAGLRAPADRPTRAQFGRKRLDLVLLHNPERFQRGDRPGLHRAIRDACVVLEEETAAGHVAGYGIATWVGLEEAAFTVEEVLALAGEAVGGQQDHHLAAVRLPVNLVLVTSIVQALDCTPAGTTAGTRITIATTTTAGRS
ncbi:hypothetical protein ACIQVL_20195 [Streptomyces sp. NPDC090499]|uniref:hypothetical protein n=1 Tax=Streptomyces sp. NPDC090499 TaxID=3365965 RepID=UPI0037FB3C92